MLTFISINISFIFCCHYTNFKAEYILMYKPASVIRQYYHFWLEVGRKFVGMEAKNWFSVTIVYCDVTFRMNW